MRPHARTVLAAPLLAVLLAGALAACGRPEAPTGQAFCDAVTAKLDQLKGPVTDPATAAKAVQAYQDVAKVAPAPVRDAWNTVTDLVEAASSLDLASKDAQAKFAERALRAAGDVKTITDYTQTTCGVTLSARG
jgi:hypothetical protein